MHELPCAQRSRLSHEELCRKREAAAVRMQRIPEARDDQLRPEPRSGRTGAGRGRRPGHGSRGGAGLDAVGLPGGGFPAGGCACVCSAASARPVATWATIAGPGRICGPCVSRGAQAAGVRPLPPPAVRPYAVPRRTRRRGDAARGAAGPAVWGRRRAGVACACCARYATSWSPASSSSCS